MDKILKITNVIYILIKFSNIPVQENALIKLSNIKTLIKLELSFIDSNITKIPEAIFSIQSLKTLYIHNIKANELPMAICNLKNLETLIINQTEITTLPESIGELSKLKVLEVEINCITHLPSSIKELRALETLCIFNNCLNEIPQSFSELKNLVKLDIRWNETTLITSESINILRSNNPLLLEILTFDIGSEEHLEQLRYDTIYEFYSTLNTSTLIYDDFDSLQEACKQIIKVEFGSDNKDIFIENVRSLKDLLIPIQLWC